MHLPLSIGETDGKYIFSFGLNVLKLKVIWKHSVTGMKPKVMQYF
jgi:hypothetical protein